MEENDSGMKNYIYLAYIEIWGYTYYYQSQSEKEYRFVAGQAPKYSNPSGDKIECSMQWEEV